MKLERVNLNSDKNQVGRKKKNNKNNLTTPNFGLPKVKIGNLAKDVVSFGSPVVQKNVIWRNISDSAVSNIAKFIDKFEDATAWMRRSDLGRRLIKDTSDDKKVAQRNGISYPDTEYETSISTGIFSSDNYRATYLGGGMSGDAYRVQVDGDTKYVIKEAKDKKCSDPINGAGGIKHEYEMLEQFEPDSKFQQGIALMKTEDGNYFLISHFAEGEAAGKDGYSLNKMSQENIKDTLNILENMDNKNVFNPDWNLGNIFYQGDSKYPKVLDLQWAYPTSRANDFFHFVPGEKKTNMVAFEGGAIASYMHHLYEETGSKGQTRDFLKMYLKERAKHCDSSNRLERIRKAVYENPTEDVLDAEILRLSVLQNNIHQFMYTDKQNEEPRDMLKMVRYQARANFAAKMLSEFQPQGYVSGEQKEYFEEMRDFGRSWHDKTKSDYKGSINYMKRLVTGEERQTTGYYASGLFYWPKYFGTGVDGTTHSYKNAVPDKTKLSDILSSGAKSKWDEVMEDDDDEEKIGLKTRVIKLEAAFINLKNAVEKHDSSLESKAKKSIGILTGKVLP